MTNFDFEKREVKKTVSYTLKPSTIQVIKDYAEIKDTTASQVVDTLAAHFLPKIIQQEIQRQEAE